MKHWVPAAAVNIFISFIFGSNLYLHFFSPQVDHVDGKAGGVSKNVLPCTLDEATQKLIKLIFSNDMFKEAMECMNLGGCVSLAWLEVEIQNVVMKRK